MLVVRGADLSKCEKIEQGQLKRRKVARFEEMQ